MTGKGHRQQSQLATSSDSAKATNSADETLMILTVELKKSKETPAPGEIYPDHRIQNLAYCALVKDKMRVRVLMVS